MSQHNQSEHHHQLRNINQVFDEQLSIGQRAADAVANGMGSWYFIIIQSIVLVCWIVLNVVGWVQHWDPYPFILMNLVLSMQAAYAAPIIMMSQNRQAAKDRIEAHHDYLVNQKAEAEIELILSRLAAQTKLLEELRATVAALQDQQQKRT
jgi:uncharacterized membrane protein